MALLDFDFYSSEICKTVHAQAILPIADAVPAPELPLKALYLLPGFSASAHDIQWMCRIRENVLKYQIAVIIIDGDNSFYINRPMANYSNFIGKELVEFTHKLLPLSSKREDLFIGGISMGGYGAWYNGMKYSDTFSKIALIHPGFDFYDLKLDDQPAFPPAFLDSLFGSRENYYATDFDYRNMLRERRSDMPAIFQCCGTEDPLVKEVNQDFCEFLKENHVPAVTCTAPGGHDEAFINRIWDRLFEFLLERSSDYVMGQNFVRANP